MIINLDQLKRRGYKTSHKYYICKEVEEIIYHILIYRSKASFFVVVDLYSFWCAMGDAFFS